MCQQFLKLDVETMQECSFPKALSSYKYLLFQEQTKNAQFIIISLRNNMFEIADRLIGIYKTHNTTKSVATNPKVIAAKGLMELGIAEHSVAQNQSE